MYRADPDDLIGKAYDPRIARRLFAYLRPYKRRAVLTLFLIITVTICELLLPKLFAMAIDEVDGPKRHWMLNVLGATFIVTLLVRFFAAWAEYYVTSWLGYRIVYDLRNKMFRHLQTLSMSYVDRRGVGVIMTRIQNDVTVISDLFTDGIAGIIASMLILVGIVFLMLWTNWKLALLSFIVIPVMVVVTRSWQRRAVDTYRATRRTIGIVNGYLAERISGMRVVQAFSREVSSMAEFSKLNHDNFEANVDAARLSAVLFPIVNLLAAIATALILYIGGKLVFRTALTIGDLVLFIALIDRFFQPIRDLSQQYTTLQAAMAAGERIFEMLDVEPEVSDRPGAIELPPIEGQVDYNHVRFGYGDVEILHDIELHVAPGQAVALVGETGAGKTSMISLLMRFADVWSGSIEIDGHDVRDVTQQSLRSQMGIVLQDTFLFGNSVRENIRYGRQDATDAEIEQAARDVGAHDFIANLSDGYDTVVHERGVSLSVGQRQLLSFARALLADPRILILDEATSSIDTQTEKLIQEALRRLLQHRTSFVIAHRLSTIREADKVVVMHEGRIVEMGTHDELIAAHGYYFDLYAMQWRENAAAD